MSAFTWLCVFLLVGLLNTPIRGKPPSTIVKDRDLKARGISSDTEVVNDIITKDGKLHECYDSRDIECIVSMYADDVIGAPDGGAPYQGIEKFRESLVSWVYDYNVTKNPDLHIIPLGANKEYVFEFHTYDLSGPNGFSKGKVAVIWKLIDGVYKVFFEMFNSNY